MSMNRWPGARSSRPADGDEQGTCYCLGLYSCRAEKTDDESTSSGGDYISFVVSRAVTDKRARAGTTTSADGADR